MPELIGKRLRKAVGKRVSELAAEGNVWSVALGLTKPAGGEIGHEIDRHRIAVPPVGRDLQDGRPGKAAMGEQSRLSKLSCTGLSDDVRRNTREGLEQCLVAGKGQRDECGPRLDDF